MHARIQRQKKRNERFKEEQVVLWLSQALLGLKHLHERHILHRGKLSLPLCHTACTVFSSLSLPLSHCMCLLCLYLSLIHI